MREAVQQARDQGLNLGFFSSNTLYWQSRLEPVRGQPHRRLVCFKNGEPPGPGDAAERSNYLTGAHDDHLPAADRTRQWTAMGEPEGEVLGSGGTFLTTSDATTFHSADIVLTGVSGATGVGWIFAGTAAIDNGVLPRLLGMETAPIQRADTTLIAQSPAKQGGYGAFTHYVTGSPRATVVSTGSIQWSWGLDDHDVSCSRPSFVNKIATQMTRNILARLTGQPGGLSTQGARTHGFADSFFRNDRDPDVWALQSVARWPRSGAVNVVQGASATHPNGRLAITTADRRVGAHYSGYATQRAIDFRNKQVVARVAQASTSSAAQMFLALSADRNNWVGIVQDSATLRFEIKNAGNVSTAATMPFDPAVHCWWRLRHGVIGTGPLAANTIFFETNDQPDAHAWITRRSLSAPSWMSSAHLELQAGSSTPTRSELAIFDSFSVDGAQPTNLEEDFAAHYQDRAKWVTSTLSVGYAPGAGSAIQGDGVLELQLPAQQKRARGEAAWDYSAPTAWLDEPNYFGYVSRDRWDFTGKTLQVEVVESPPLDASTIVGIGTGAGHWIRFVRLGPDLIFQSSDAGAQTTAYSQAAHRWWRIKHEAPSVHLETSPDAVNWTRRRTFAEPSWLQDVKVELQLGTAQSVALATPARFRSFSMR